MKEDIINRYGIQFTLGLVFVMALIVSAPFMFEDQFHTTEYIPGTTEQDSWWTMSTDEFPVVQGRNLELSISVTRNSTFRLTLPSQEPKILIIQDDFRESFRLGDSGVIILEVLMGTEPQEITYSFRVSGFPDAYRTIIVVTVIVFLSSFSLTFRRRSEVRPSLEHHRAEPNLLGTFFSTVRHYRSAIHVSWIIIPVSILSYLSFQGSLVGSLFAESAENIDGKVVHAYGLDFYLALWKIWSIVFLSSVFTTLLLFSQYFLEEHRGHLVHEELHPITFRFRILAMYVAVIPYVITPQILTVGLNISVFRIVEGWIQWRILVVITAMNMVITFILIFVLKLFSGSTERVGVVLIFIYATTMLQREFTSMIFFFQSKLDTISRIRKAFHADPTDNGIIDTIIMEFIVKSSFWIFVVLFLSSEKIVRWWRAVKFRGMRAISRSL